MPDLLQAAAVGREPRSHKAIIMIYLPGGAPHLDLFDLKPDAPHEIRGPFRPIGTNVPGIQICEHLPRMARIMDKLMLVRPLVGAKNRHELFQGYTGRPGGQPDDNEPMGGWWSLGSTVSKLQGAGDRGIPAYVDVGPKMGYVPYNNTGYHNPPSKVRSWPGMTGTSHVPFGLAGKDRDDMVLREITTDRLENRKALLDGFCSLQTRRGCEWRSGWPSCLPSTGSGHSDLKQTG